MIRTALVNGRVLVGDALVARQAVIVEGDRILAVVPERDSVVRDIERHDLAGRMLLPGFIDTQVNGGGGVLFNTAPNVEGVRAIGAAHRRFGTTGFLPTLISDDLEVVARGIAAVDEAIAAGVPGVLGIHIEGPFINIERKGAHDASKIRHLDERHIPLLTSLKRGRTLVTLAPEVASPGVIRALALRRVLVSAGHTNATYDQMRRALREGVVGVTHLFNAMSPLSSRAPGVVGAALEDAACWCGIIVDGRHVDPATLRLALRCRPAARFLLVTDAMPTVGAAEKWFTLQGRRVSVQDGVCVDESGTLSGSDLDMAGAVRNTVAMLGVPIGDAVRMASANPADFLGRGADLGRIAPGYRANLVAADDNWNVTETWIEGVRLGA